MQKDITIKEIIEVVKAATEEEKKELAALLAPYIKVPYSEVLYSGAKPGVNYGGKTQV